MNASAVDADPKIGRSRTPVRLVLALLALPQLVIGVWSLAAPRDWFETFPGAGKRWLPLFGPYNEHLVTDVGAAFLAIGVLLVTATIRTEPRLVAAAAIAYLAFQIPHTIYHLASDDRMTAGDELINGTLLGGATLAAAWLLLAVRLPRDKRAGSPPASVSDGDGTGGIGRLRSRRRGALARIARSYGRHRFGKAPAPVDAYLLHPGLLLGYATFETTTERSNKVDERLKLLAELKAATIVRCEWCMDFGSRLSYDHGIPERKLRELARYRDSDAFTELEKLVLNYAAAMTRTPPEIDDMLFARLREHFDDAQLIELTNVIALENHRARFNSALGLDAQGFSERVYCVVAEQAGHAPAYAPATRAHQD